MELPPSGPAPDATVLNWNCLMMRASALPILTFHSLDDKPSPLSYPPQLFRHVMERFHAAGHRAITAAEAARCIRDGSPWPERAFVITFDDGYRSVFESGLPVLRRLGFAATIFLNTGPTEGPELAPWEGRPRMSWDQIRQMREAGCEIGAHSVTHPNLCQLEAARVEEEVSVSQAVVAEATGAPVNSFCYPFGVSNVQVRDIVRRYYGCACCGELKLVTPASDIFDMSRVEMHYFRNEPTLRLLTGAGLGSYLFARRLLRKVRHAVAGPVPPPEASTR
jgi:peptidoglycan/xylan/chitin deacetylase (PgdA/CDA1 family)